MKTFSTARQHAGRLDDPRLCPRSRGQDRGQTDGQRHSAEVLAAHAPDHSSVVRGADETTMRSIARISSPLRMYAFCVELSEARKEALDRASELSRALEPDEVAGIG